MGKYYASQTWLGKPLNSMAALVEKESVFVHCLIAELNSGCLTPVA
jgi:hypothetical protein